MTFFADSATSTEASAELIRPKLAEASAEASVSVVHYTIHNETSIFRCKYITIYLHT